MDDVRCPMCGKPNPADQEVCQYCQARLTPVHFPPSDESSPFNGSGESLPPDDDIPEWLRSFREETPGMAEPEETPGEEIPDWLSSLRAQEPEEEVSAAVTGQSGDEDEFPSFPPGEQEAGEGESESPETTGEEAALPAEEKPDWLQDIRLRQQFEQSPTESEPEGSPEQEGDLPSWLSDFGQSEEQPEESQPEPSQPVEEEPPASTGAEHPEEEGEELPAWLQSEAYSEKDQPEAEVPDWFDEAKTAGTETGDQEPQAEAPEGESSEAEEPIPDWLSGVGQEAGEEEAEESPAWLNQFDEETASVEELSGENISPEPGEQEDEFESNWLQSVLGEAGSTGAQSFPPDEEESFLEGDLPDWLASVSPEDIQASAAQPGSAMEELGYIEDSEEEESLIDDAFVEAVSSRGGEGAGIEPAELPGWLEAMRPIESAAELPEESPGVVESAGPLAGLQGVLPSEPQPTPGGKTGPYQIKLQVTEAQQANATLFELMIKSEEDARPLPRRRTLASQHILRILFGILLFLAVLYPLVVETPAASVPQVYASQVLAASNLIARLTPGAPVLVAFDYEPGWSAELDAAAAPVMDHLMSKNAFLAVVSTSPTGAVQAERVISQVNRQRLEGERYQAIANYLNLGFIPGGPSGLAAFAQTPRQVFPVSMVGGLAWENTPLQNISRIGEFSMVVVITEDPDTARAWIEQVDPLMGDTPLMMVVSAQADPLVRPYYGTQPSQVEALVSGLEGGAVYASLDNRPGSAETYWNAYSLGINIAAALILIGGLFNVALGLFERRKYTEGEA